jgi:hypothetical protein
VPDFTSQPSFAGSDSRFVAVAARGASRSEKSNGTGNSNKKKIFLWFGSKTEPNQ